MHTTGTNHFVSRAAALRYYQNYHKYDVTDEVDLKIRNGEIVVGKPPPIKIDQTLSTDRFGRYMITTP